MEASPPLEMCQPFSPFVQGHTCVRAFGRPRLAALDRSRQHVPLSSPPSPALSLALLIPHKTIRSAQIPAEFAHDVHGHGLTDSASAPGAGAGEGSGGSTTASKAAPRGGRKPDPARQHAGIPTGSGVPGHERSLSLGQSGMTPGAAAAAAAAAVTAAASGVRGGGHNRTGSGPALMGPRGMEGMGMGMEKAEWDGGQGPLPSLDSVTGGLRTLHGGMHGNGGGGQGGGAEVRERVGKRMGCC